MGNILKLIYSCGKRHNLEVSARSIVQRTPKCSNYATNRRRDDKSMGNFQHIRDGRTDDSPELCALNYTYGIYPCPFHCIDSRSLQQFDHIILKYLSRSTFQYLYAFDISLAFWKFKHYLCFRSFVRLFGVRAHESSTLPFLERQRLTLCDRRP